MAKNLTTMAKKTITCPTTDEWSDKYTPVKNHIDKNAGFDFGNGYGSMFETFGKELEHVLSVVKSNPQTVWTLVEAEGDLYIIAGYHLVNRLGYFITAETWSDEFEEYFVN